MLVFHHWHIWLATSHLKLLLGFGSSEHLNPPSKNLWAPPVSTSCLSFSDASLEELWLHSDLQDGSRMKGRETNTQVVRAKWWYDPERSQQQDLQQSKHKSVLMKPPRDRTFSLAPKERKEFSWAALLVTRKSQISPHVLNASLILPFLYS